MINPFKKKVAEEKEELDSELPVKKVRRRRKKDENLRPWGKIERFVVLVFLLLSPILSIFFFLHSKNPSQIKVLGDITSRSTKDTNELKTSLLNELQNKTETYGIWLQAVDGSFSLGINEDEKFDGASLFKLPLMLTYYAKVDAGTIDPGTNYTIKYSDAMAGAGILATLPPGTIITYQDMVDYMGKNSDNSAFAIMQNILGVNSESDMINKLGMTNTDLGNSLTSPRDIGLLFYKLINTDLISVSSRNKLLNSLKNTDYETLLPAGIPDNIEVAHKYAGDDGELNDAGVIYTSKPFILVILAKNINAQTAHEFSALAKIVYEWTTK